MLQIQALIVLQTALHGEQHIREALSPDLKLLHEFSPMTNIEKNAAVAVDDGTWPAPDATLKTFAEILGVLG